MSDNYIKKDQHSIYENIRGSVLVMKYSRDENIPLNLIDEISNNRSVSFSVFLTIKTDKAYDNQAVLTLSRFNSKMESIVVLKRFSLNPTQNAPTNNEQCESEKTQLPFDNMSFEHNIRLNCQDVATKGPGDYAISLRLLHEDGELKNASLIDAFYFRITD